MRYDILSRFRIFRLSRRLRAIENEIGYLDAQIQGCYEDRKLLVATAQRIRKTLSALCIVRHSSRGTQTARAR